jgi:hypothetical protein
MFEHTFIGLDVHAFNVVGYALNPDTGEITQPTTATDPVIVLEWVRRFEPPGKVVYESGPARFVLARYLQTAALTVWWRPDPGGPVGDQTCSSTPSASTPSSGSVAATRRDPSTTRTTAQTVCQETLSWWARAETEGSNRRSASVAQWTARAVSFARGPAGGCISLNVVLGQSRSGHRQTRLAHSAPAGRNRGCHGPGPAGPLADRADAAVGATGQAHTGIDQYEASPGCRDEPT